MSVAREEIVEDSIIRIPFTTHDKNGGAVAPSSAFEAGDVRIYKDDSNTQKTTTNGITIASPKDSITGFHFLNIDTSEDSGDAGFWVAGGEYIVVLSPTSETVDSETIVSVIGRFRILTTPELIPRYNGAIHFSSSGGSSAVIGIDGTPLIPTAQPGLANILSNSTGIPVIKIESTFTADQNFEGKVFEGLDNSANFHGAAGFTLNNCILRNIILSNGQLGDNTTNVLVENSTITDFGSSLTSGKFNKCIFEGGTIFSRTDGGLVQLVDCDNVGPSPVMLRADFGAEFHLVNFKGDAVFLGSNVAGKFHRIHMQGGHLMIQFETTGTSFLMITGYGVLDDQSGPNFYVDTTGFFNASGNTQAPVTLADNATNKGIVGAGTWDSLRANHSIANSFGENVLADIIKWNGSQTVDGVGMTAFAEIILAYASGRFRTNFPNAGDVTFFKQDNTTTLFVMNVTTDERTRV